MSLATLEKLKRPLATVMPSMTSQETVAANLTVLADEVARHSHINADDSVQTIVMPKHKDLALDADRQRVEMSAETQADDIGMAARAIVEQYKSDAVADSIQSAETL